MLSDGVGGNAAFDLIPFHTEIGSKLLPLLWLPPFHSLPGPTSLSPRAFRLTKGIPPAISCATGITCTISQVIKKRSVKQLR